MLQLVIPLTVKISGLLSCDWKSLTIGILNWECRVIVLETPETVRSGKGFTNV